MEGVFFRDLGFWAFRLRVKGLGCRARKPSEFSSLSIRLKLETE